MVLPVQAYPRSGLVQAGFECRQVAGGLFAGPVVADVGLKPGLTGFFSDERQVPVEIPAFGWHDRGKRGVRPNSAVVRRVEPKEFRVVEGLGCQDDFG